LTSLHDYGGLLLASRLKKVSEALYAGVEPVDEPHPASPPGGELTAAAVHSLDPHQVKLVEACRRGLAAAGDPAFAAAAETVTGLP